MPQLNKKKLIFAITCIATLFCAMRLYSPPSLMQATRFGRAYYARDGQLMRITLAGDDKYRLYTPLAEISPALADATILYEDKFFRYHIGVNPWAFVRATASYFNPQIRNVGASTITMQVARMIYHMDTRRIGGKLKQIAAALYIEATYSKDQILEAYLNLAPYGGNIEGIGAASLIYFNKRPADLTTIEAITLATIPQNPTVRGLNTARGMENMMRMRADLVRRWSQQYASDASLATFADMPIAARGTRDLPFMAPHFTDRLISNHDYWDDIGPHESNVETTLDLKLQTVLQESLSTQVRSRRDKGIQNAAAILVNFKTMEVLSYIGSVDYFNPEILGENDGVHARRSPGSTLKPLIYAAAADRGLIHSMTLMRDAPISFGVYAPENADNEFYGPVLARDALTHSRNIPAIHLVRELGPTNFYNLLLASGVTGLRAPSHYGVSIAMGGAEVSMYELARIYAMMANMGMWHDLRTISTTPIDNGQQILSPEAFFITMDMLGRQSNGTRHIPFTQNKSNGPRHYWKTGTSSSYRDAWTAGIFGDYVLIVWVGNFDGRPNNAFSGAHVAAPIYFALANTVAKYDAARGRPIQDNNFLRDDMNISEIEMCDGVGGIAGAHCPRAVPAYFIPGVSPIDTSSVYRAVAIDIKTGRRACLPDPQTTRMAVYEFWDPEFLDMFRRAGVKRNTPPSFMDGCDLDHIITNRPAPQILSPGDNMRTVIVKNETHADVSFQALTDMPDTRIFWFMDDAIIGTSHSGDVFTHPVKIGEHKLRAVDEMGAATEINFMVVR